MDEEWIDIYVYMSSQEKLTTKLFQWEKKTYRKLILEIIVEVIGVLKFSINNTASKNGIK